MRYADLLREYGALARKAKKEEEAIKILMLHHSKMAGNELYLRINEIPEPAFLDKFKEDCQKYLTEEVPVQHLTGCDYFFGYQFIVNKNVLIPRRETEELVEHTLYLYDEIFKNAPVKILDIGTGSGCIAITLKKEIEKSAIWATDISIEALEVAKQNAKNLSADVNFLTGSVYEPVKNKCFDIIISNPPYIPEAEDVCNLVRNNEPHLALFGGNDGLKFYLEIINEAKSYLNKRTFIGFEHAFDKALAIKEIALKAFPKAEIRQFKDMQGLDRFTFIINN
ncbi:MAG: peptide chain release factor N(5)-glutamine methyltransferase [Erysipelotrichales bacterium]|nr:peptide chain release factor N(5)-glutamine methyltransferase [Erysipelotrichales bacterium]